MIEIEPLPANLADWMIAPFGPAWAAMRFERARVDRTAAGKVARMEPLFGQIPSSYSYLPSVRPVMLPMMPIAFMAQTSCQSLAAAFR